MILKIYKITSIAILKTETYISFLNLHLNVKLAKFCQHHKQSEMKKLVIKSCRQIQNKLQILLKMSYDDRRNLETCKSNYIAIQSCLSYTELVLQAEEQMLDWACLTALWEILHTIYNENSLEESCRLWKLLSWISNTVDSLISVSEADLHITRHPVSACRLGLLANHWIQ